MKKQLLKFSGLVAALILSASAIGQTNGTLTFTFTTIAHSGYQSTKNVLAVWIQTSSGGFVKTFYRYAGSGTNDHLPTWAVNSGGSASNCLSASCNKVGATTGATLSGATTKTVTWDGKDAAGNLVADGTYKVTIQETWDHGTSGTTTRSFTFTKGTSADTQTPTTDANFTGISLNWQPSSAGVEENTSIISSVFPNPSADGIFNVTFEQASAIKVIDMMGKEVASMEVKNNETSKVVDLTAVSNGNYVLQIFNGANVKEHKIMINKK